VVPRERINIASSRIGIVDCVTKKHLVESDNENIKIADGPVD